jgi:hypothetical protein
MERVTVDPEMAQFLTLSDMTIPGAVPTDVKTWQTASAPKVWEPKVRAIVERIVPSSAGL